MPAIAPTSWTSASLGSPGTREPRDGQTHTRREAGLPGDLHLLGAQATRSLLVRLAAGGIPEAWRGALGPGLPGDAEPTGSAPTAGLPAELDALLRQAALPGPLAQAVARAWDALRRPVTRGTADQYEVVALRLARLGRLPAEGGVRRRSFVLHRAALLRIARLGLVALAREVAVVGERGDRRRPCLEGLRDVALAVTWLSAARWGAVRTDVHLPGHPHLRRRSTGKRRGLGRLPGDWRERVLRAFLLGRHPLALAVHVLAAFGVRPAELVRGVVLAVDQELGLVVARIPCAKRKAGTEQDNRVVGILPEAPAALALWRVLVDAGEPVAVQVDDARRLCDAVRRAARRALPEMARSVTVSPYSFRHQLAADAKAAVAALSGGGDRTAVSALLGHRSGRSQRAYGTRRQARGGLTWTAHTVPVLRPAAEAVPLVALPQPAALSPGSLCPGHALQ